MKFYSKGSFGSKRAFTPEGFLICYDVPIASTALMLYAEGEIPVDAGKDGLIRVTRTPEELFSPATIASFEGKASVNDHPEEDVTPENWKELSVGHVQNVRRGEGELEDCLLADLVITDLQAIKDIEDGKREVSCGYDADYEQLSAGVGQQHNIIGNHVALVEKGRCGPRCAIGDKAMAVKKVTLRDRVRALIKGKDAEGVEKLMEDAGIDLGEVHDEEGSVEAGRGDTHVHVHLGAKAEEAPASDADETERPDAGGSDVDSRFEAIENTLADLAEAVAKLANSESAEDDEEESDEVLGEDAEVVGEGRGEGRGEEGEGGEILGEDKAKGRDAAMGTLSTEARNTFSRAEILVPGIKFPTVDSKNPKKTRDALCKFRKDALKKAWAVGGKSRDAISSVLAGNKLNLRTATCDSVAVLFNGAAAVVGKQNSPVIRKDLGGNVGIGPKNVADINAQNRAFWKHK